MIEIKMKRIDGMAQRLAKKHKVPLEVERSIGKFKTVQVVYDALRANQTEELAVFDTDEQCWLLLSDKSLWSDIEMVITTSTDPEAKC